jgi:hypothetical protein
MASREKSARGLDALLPEVPGVKRMMKAWVCVWCGWLNMTADACGKCGQ